MRDEIQLLLDVANEYGQVNVTVDEIKKIRADAIDKLIELLPDCDKIDIEHLICLLEKIKEQK